MRLLFVHPIHFLVVVALCSFVSSVIHLPVLTGVTDDVKQFFEVPSVSYPGLGGNAAVALLGTLHRARETCGARFNGR